MSSSTLPGPGGAGVTKHDAARWLGGIGWFAKGIVYVLVGLLALQLAYGDVDDEASKQGALRTLVEQPAGSLLLLAVVVGLFAYAAYELVRVWINDDDGHEKAAKAVGHIGTAIAYTVVGAQGVAILLAGGSNGGGGSEGSEAPRTWSARLLESGIGTVVLVGVGLGLFGYAGYQVYMGLSRSFMDKIECAEHPKQSAVAEKVGLVGITARGVVFGLFGLFVLQAVASHDANQVQGLDGALRELQRASFGPGLLLGVALGLMSYGAYNIVGSRCRRHEAG